jgi:hypothetical protein
MSLPDPAAVLSEFSKKLNPQGILRIMVYPHYGRQRVFHIQKLAKLLGLGPKEPSHPACLRRLMSQLPDSHPLKATFFDYPDSKNLPGIVDGFLHASDRAFTGEEISNLLDRAGFELGFCYHRPWGQPEEMARKLGLAGKDPAFWLQYLDLWQSLKSNFILTLVHKGNGSSRTQPSQLKKHPLFDLRKTFGFRHKLRLVTKSILGGKIQSRTHEEGFLKLNSREFRSVVNGSSSSAKAEEVLAQKMSLAQSFFHKKRSFPKPSDPWKVGLGLSPNPLYRHLFDAFTFSEEFKKSGENFISFEEELIRWKGLSRPLETEEKPWGLTPWVTYQCNHEAIRNWLKTRIEQPELSISEVKLKNEEQKIAGLLKFLITQKGIVIPKDPNHLRILWVLLMSEDQLFLEFDQ